MDRLRRRAGKAVRNALSAVHEVEVVVQRLDRLAAGAPSVNSSVPSRVSTCSGVEIELRVSLETVIWLTSFGLVGARGRVERDRLPWDAQSSM